MTTTTAPSMARVLVDACAVARTHGAAAALTALADVVPVACVPGGYVLLPPDLTPPDGAHRVADVPTTEAPLTVWRVPPDGGVLAPRSAAADLTWRTGVAGVRLGLSERLLETACDRLRHRTVAGTATIDLPPVRLAIADATLAHLMSRALLSTVEDALSATTLGTVSAALDDSGRAVLNLFGAAGYLDDAPGRLARVSELLGHASGTVPHAPEPTAHDEEAS